MARNCNVIVIFPIYSQFGAIWKLDSRGIVCKTYVFISSNKKFSFYVTKTENRTAKSQTQLSHYCFK